MHGSRFGGTSLVRVHGQGSGARFQGRCTVQVRVHGSRSRFGARFGFATDDCACCAVGNCSTRSCHASRARRRSLPCSFAARVSLRKCLRRTPSCPSRHGEDVAPSCSTFSRTVAHPLVAVRHRHPAAHRCAQRPSRRRRCGRSCPHSRRAISQGRERRRLRQCDPRTELDFISESTGRRKYERCYE